ncbi:MAG: hypothetical protein WCE49_15320, partial [Terrimicrobiaceae bacterium]
MRPYLPQITVVTYVVAYAVVIPVDPALFPARQFFDSRKSLNDAAGILLSTSDIVNLSRARCFEKGMDKASNIFRMDVVADLFALVAEDFVFATLEVAFDEVTEEAMQFYPGM